MLGAASSEPVICFLPAIVKAVAAEGGKRVIEVEASNQAVDAEGDVVMQKALLDSAASFIATGHIDIDHISEIGDRVGISDPASYIIGRPVEVKDGGDTRTVVRAEIMRAADGSFDPKTRKYDEFWRSLQSEPPVAWRASIYGFPKAGGVEMIKNGRDPKTGATRSVIKSLDWRSLAMTRNPINTSITGTAQIVTAKSYAAAVLAKARGEDVPEMVAPEWVTLPRSLDELWGQYDRHIARDCPHCGLGMGVGSTTSFRDHFLQCCFADPDTADVLAHALMYLLMKERHRR